MKKTYITPNQLWCSLDASVFLQDSGSNPSVPVFYNETDETNSDKSRSQVPSVWDTEW